MIFYLIRIIGTAFSPDRIIGNILAKEIIAITLIVTILI